MPFRHSFRSGPNLLGAVDKVFERPEAYRGLSADNVRPVHECAAGSEARPRRVWDTIKPKEKREIEAWDAPFDELTEKSPQVRLAAKIAANVKRWTKQGTRAGDVLILVRQRGAVVRGDHPRAQGCAMCRWPAPIGWC